MLFAPLASLNLAAVAPATFSLAGMALLFLKIGAVLYGSGYVLLAFLRADFRGSAGLADGNAAAGRRGDWSGDTGPGVYHRDVYRVPAGRGSWRHRGNGRDLPSVIRVRGRDSPACRATARIQRHGPDSRRRQPPPPLV